MAKAIARSVRLSPRKAQLLAASVQGRRVSEALATLRFSTRSAARPLYKVIASAAANAQQNEKARPENLVVSSLRADAGPRLKRFRPAARGRSAPYIHARTHLTAVVTEVAPVAPEQPAATPRAKAAEPATEEKTTESAPPAKAEAPAESEAKQTKDKE